MKQKAFFSFIAAVLVGSFAVSCATKASASSKPGSGLEEFRELVIYAMNSVKSTMNSLDTLTESPGRKSFDVFAGSVSQLEVDSIQVRARFQALVARGDAYFDEWSQQLARITNGVERQAEQKREVAFKQSFDRIRRSASQTRQDFDSFFSGLHRLRAILEKNPALESLNASRALVSDTVKSGHQVQEGIGEVLAELNAMTLQFKRSSPDHSS